MHQNAQLKQNKLKGTDNDMHRNKTVANRHKTATNFDASINHLKQIQSGQMNLISQDTQMKSQKPRAQQTHKLPAIRCHTSFQRMLT